MANKHTKKALLMSMLSILLCLSMLVGSTFAWFTDTASTGVNTIVAGNLDVELEYSTDLNTWNSVEGKTDLFKKETLWEPGHTEVAYLRVRNAGSLAVDYDLYAFAAAETVGKNASNGDIRLSTALKFAVRQSDTSPAAKLTRAEAQAAAENTANAYALNNKFEADNVLSGITKYFTVIIYMPTSYGNDYNYVTGTTPPSIDLKIKLEAIQATVEEDSFGKDYDETANGTPDHPEFGQTPPTVETVQDAIPTKVENGVETVETQDPVDVIANDITVTYANGVKLDAAAADTASKEDGNNTADAKQGLVYTGNTSTENPSITVANGESLEVYDLILPVAQDNTVPVKVVKNIGMNKTITGVKHNATDLENNSAIPAVGTLSGDQGYYSYDPASGELTMWVLHASEISIQVKVDASINGVVYPTLGDAVADAKPDATVTLVPGSTSELGNVTNGVDITGDAATKPTLTVSEETGVNIGAGSVLSNVTIEDTNTSNGRYYCGVVNLMGDCAAIQNSVVNGKGATTWDAAVYVHLKKGETAYITNTEINGGFRGIFLGSQSGSLVVDGCTVNPKAYTISVDGGGDFELLVKNSTLKGWLSYSAIKSANFVNTKFGSNGSYAFFRPYSASTLTNCDFETGYEIDTSMAPITLIGCTIAGEPLTAENAGVLFGGTVPANVTIQ